MSISVSRESISKLMTELVDSFPMESDGRASISDFGKLLFTEGQSNGGGGGTALNGNGAGRVGTGSNNSEDDNDDDGVDDEDVPGASPNGMQARSNKRVFTEIKGVPRQKQHDIMKSKDKAVPKRWTQEEDDRLREAVGRHGERNWKSIAEEVPGRNHTQCLQRWTKVLAPGLVKGHWRPDEDELLKELVAEGRKNWGQVATRIPGRTSKQCRERWYNHLDPSIVRGEYTPEEDRIILEAQARLGNRWSAIAAMLPGRTEDAVKIRWKSLCRVRKGQGRRGQGEKGKATPPKATGLPPHMMHHPHTGAAHNFGGNLVKSEELGAFSSPMVAHAPVVQLTRMTSGGGGQPMVTPVTMTTGHHPNMGIVQHHHHMAPAMNTQPMMYASEMVYDPTTGQYRKVAVQPMTASGSTYGHSLPPTVPAPGEYSLDRRANVVNISTPHGYRPGYTTTTTTYATDMNGNVYTTHAPGMNTAVSYAPAQPQMATMTPLYRSVSGGGGPVMNPPHMSPHQMMSSSSPYGYSMPSNASPVNTNGMNQHTMQQMNPAAAFAQQFGTPQSQHAEINHHQEQQQHPHHQVENHPEHDTQEQPNPEEPPSPQQEQEKETAKLGQSGKPLTPVKTNSNEPSSTQALPPPAPALVNPAAMFAQSQVPQKSAVSSSEAPKAAFAGNPVAAFLQQQQKRKEQPQASSTKPSGGVVGAGGIKPFNPAAAFAQRFQPSNQKPPMPSSSSNKSVDGDDDDDDAENGDKSKEPSLKKVKPRLSIDAARASAARRMRNSGSGAALAGRGSLDVFLNEIGDVGRLSDLKMDEFQTLDELWRVSDDMNRLSL